MKDGVRKKGVSPTVASVLMIVLVLALAIIVFLWTRGFISEQINKFGLPIEQACEQVSFEVFRDGDELEILNKGDVNIRYFEIKAISGGDSESANFDVSVDAGETVVDHFTFSQLFEDPEEIIIYPVLLGEVEGEYSNSAFTCLNSGVMIELNGA